MVLYHSHPLQATLEGISLHVLDFVHVPNIYKFIAIGIEGTIVLWANVQKAVESVHCYLVLNVWMSS